MVRFYFNCIALGWLAILTVLDVIGNGNSTGFLSDVYMVKSGLDVVLLLWTGVMMYTAVTGRKLDIDLGKSEYIYFGAMAFYAFVSLIGHHSLNKESTGPLAFVTLIMVWVDVALAAFAGYNFWVVFRTKAAAIQNQIKQRVNRLDH
jgi:hypothetical protein